MPYIAREDGEHFVIPSYRDVLSAKRKGFLKKEILLLSQSYGEYITLNRKNATQYEVAFSPDTGHLLGESIWHHFKRPFDMIYCEAIPNTTEAILVIVKDGSVYLDGSFPIDSIQEELIIFLTQKNNFEIYIYGNVPITQTPEEGKFSFDASSVKSFTVLDKSVFQTAPLLKIYQLQLVDSVLKAQGIGVFPIKQLVTLGIVVGLLWMFWSYMTMQKAEVTGAAEANPYQLYTSTLTSPSPDQEINRFLDKLGLLFTMPGWIIQKIDYTKGSIIASVTSKGSKIENLIDWSNSNGVKVDITPKGIYVETSFTVPDRSAPGNIYPMKQIIGSFIDKLANVYPGNHLQLGDFAKKGVYTDTIITITVDNITPALLALIGAQFKDLPFVLQKMTLTVNNGSLTGTITIEALGS